MNKFDKRHIEKVRHTIGKTINTNNLIEDGDRILVGLSGGKDSLILLETLAERRKYSSVKYEVFASHIKVENVPYKIYREYLEEFCKNLNVPFIYKSVEYKEDRQTESPCYFCSWTRRKELFNLSKEINCNKIATGHHLDDALETLMMNMVYHGSISSLPAKFTMFEGRIEFIRPMIETMEDLLVKYAEIREYPKLKSECPFDSKTNRKTIRNVIENLQEINGQAKINMFRSMKKICKEYLP